ncbi:MAG: hypothetical protein V5B59_15570 [Candidatus Accumulibacter contiguus]|nr:hypothetical protein [Candidatus Accumulibacter contiguus]
MLDPLAKVVHVAVRHFVERIEQQQDAALAQQHFQVGQTRRLPMPLRLQPVERARRIPGRIPVERILAERYEERNPVASLSKTLAGIIKLQAPQQGGLAATRRVGDARFFAGVRVRRRGRTGCAAACAACPDADQQTAA